MQRKSSGIILVAALALAFASAPAFARGGGHGGGGHGGGGHGGGGHGGMAGARSGGGGAMAATGGRGMARSGGSIMSGRSAGGARFAGRGFGNGGFQGHRHFRNRGIGLGLGYGFAYGAAPYVPYSYYDTYPYDDEPVYESAQRSTSDDGYCSQRFRSYDPDSGTYLGYDGERHPCP
jgi:hypothetical protein